MGNKQKPDSLNQDRIQIQFRIYDKNQIAWMRENQIGNQWFKEQISKAMRKDRMTADGRAMVICSVINNNPGMSPEDSIKLVESIIESAEIST